MNCDERALEVAHSELDLYVGHKICVNEQEVHHQHDQHFVEHLHSVLARLFEWPNQTEDSCLHDHLHSNDVNLQDERVRIVDHSQSNNKSSQ